MVHNDLQSKQAGGSAAGGGGGGGGGGGVPAPPGGAGGSSSVVTAVLRLQVGPPICPLSNHRSDGGQSIGSKWNETPTTLSVLFYLSSPCLSLSLSLFHSLCFSLSLSLYLCLFLCLCLSLASRCLCLLVFSSICASPTPSPSPSVAGSSSPYLFFPQGLDVNDVADVWRGGLSCATACWLLGLPPECSVFYPVGLCLSFFLILKLRL